MYYPTFAQQRSVSTAHKLVLSLALIFASFAVWSQNASAQCTTCSDYTVTFVPHGNCCYDVVVTIAANKCDMTCLRIDLLNWPNHISSIIPAGGGYLQAWGGPGNSTVEVCPPMQLPAGSHTYATICLDPNVGGPPPIFIAIETSLYNTGTGNWECQNTQFVACP